MGQISFCTSLDLIIRKFS